MPKSCATSATRLHALVDELARVRDLLGREGSAYMPRIYCRIVSPASNGRETGTRLRSRSSMPCRSASLIN